MTQRPSTFWLATLLVCYALIIILWGAFVRFSGSGDGCGAHWPFCHGRFVPDFFEPEVFIEFFHRAKSGFFGVLTIVLVFMSRREFASGHPIRTATLLVLLLTISEGLIGAGLVLFGWVGTDDSWQRVVVIALHFLNTIALLAALLWCAWTARFVESPSVVTLSSRQRRYAAFFVIAFILMIVTGSMASLSNTLYPTDSLRSGLQADLSPDSPLLLRLRILHPLLASALAIVLLWLLSHFSEPLSKRFRDRCAFLIIANVAIGAGTLLSLSPVAAKLLHLLCVDLIWIHFCLLVLSLRYRHFRAR
jgi:heme A synthase